jgi:hypothetical protein
LSVLTLRHYAWGETDRITEAKEEHLGMLKIMFAFVTIALAGCAAQESYPAAAPFPIVKTWYWPGGGDAHGYPAYLTVKSIDVDGTVQGYIRLVAPPLVRTHAPIQKIYQFGMDQDPPVRAHWSGWRLEIEWVRNGTHYYLDRNEDGALTGTFYYGSNGDFQKHSSVAIFAPE